MLQVCKLNARVRATSKQAGVLYTRRCTRTHTHTYAAKPTNTRTRKYTHTHIHAHTHTHTTKPRPPPEKPPQPWHLSHWQVVLAGHIEVSHTQVSIVGEVGACSVYSVVEGRDHCRAYVCVQVCVCVCASVCVCECERV